MKRPKIYIWAKKIKQKELDVPAIYYVFSFLLSCLLYTSINNMKIDLVRTIVAIGIGALIGWGFYALAQDSVDGQPLGCLLYTSQASQVAQTTRITRRRMELIQLP